jgi:hypothetical protein
MRAGEQRAACHAGKTRVTEGDIESLVARRLAERYVGGAFQQ